MKKSNIGRRVVKGIGNGIFALVLLFCLALSVSFLLLDGNTFLGKRFGVIQSESMTASGYLKNDIVYIQDASLIEVGDVIVFYWAPDQYEAVDFDEKKASLWVHEVVAVKNENGSFSYLTKGSSNETDDGLYISSRFVLGKAVLLPAFFQRIFQFALTPLGLSVLLVMPCCLLLGLLSWELIVLLKEKEEVHLEIKSEVRYKKSFFARLMLAEADIKERYLKLKKTLLTYRNCHDRISWKFETYRIGRKPFVRIDVRGKTIRLYFALNREQMEGKYAVIDQSNRRTFASFPSLLKVKSDRALRYALELIDQTAEANGFVKRKIKREFSVSLDWTFEELLTQGYIKEERKDDSFFIRKGGKPIENRN